MLDMTSLICGVPGAYHAVVAVPRVPLSFNGYVLRIRVGGVIVMAIFFRERFNTAKTASLLLSVVVLMLAIFRDKIIF
jgi:hypothetical protein